MRACYHISPLNRELDCSLINEMCALQDDLDRTMDKIQVDSESVMSDMRKLLDRLDARGDIMKKLPGHASRLPFFRSIDSVVAKIKEQNEQIAAGLAKRDEEQARKPRKAAIAAAEEMSPEERVKQLEDMLKVSVTLISYICFL